MTSEKWNQIVLTQESKFYHLAEWGTLLNKIPGHQLFYLQEKDGVFSLAYVRSLIFGNRLISLPFADYGGPCSLSEKTAEKLILRAEEEAKKLKVDFLEIRTPAKKYFPLFEGHGFVRRDDYLTFIINLNKGLALLWKEIGVKNRNMVNKARQNNIKIILAQNKSDLKIFYHLYLKTMKRLGSPPQSFLFFEKIWDLFHPQNLLLPLAFFNGQGLAGGLFFLHQDIIHHAYACSLKENLKPGTNNLLLWSVIEWGQNQSFRYFDLGRTRKEAGNLLFKKRWGGKLVSMPYFYKFYKKELEQRQEIKYQKFSRLWAKYLPGFVAKKIGPWLIKQIG